MASTGVTAWMKYFQGKGDIETVVKKASQAYYPDDPMKRMSGVDVAAGTKCTYLKVSSYESKALITFKKNSKVIMCRVPFNNLAKPGNKASRAASLKPQAFGVKEQQYSITAYNKIINDAIDERSDLSAPLKAYLEALYGFCSGDRNITRSVVTKVFNEVKNDIPLNDIKKDFGEVVGPVACYTSQLLKTKGITLPQSMKIYMPLRPNEPLMDYGIFVGDKQYVISAKSGKTTNTVKPPDILDLLAKNPKKERKWKDTAEYKLLDMLANNSILLGPIKAIAATTDLITEEAASKLQPKGELTGLTTFIKSNDYLKEQASPTMNMVMYECEKLLAKMTKDGTLNMNQLFADAISEKVLYVKFDLDPQGLPKWEVIASDDITGPTYGNVSLRTKNGYTRASDRMGIQL
jgi:hypothetical protein